MTNNATRNVHNYNKNNILNGTHAAYEKMLVTTARLFKHLNRTFELFEIRYKIEINSRHTYTHTHTYGK